MINALRAPGDRRWYRLALAALIVGAWAALALWGASPAARLLDHHSLEDAELPPIVAMLVFLAGWTLMVIAMMLPASLPLVNLVARLVDDRPRPKVHVTVLCLGYLFAWLILGLLIVLADRLVHAAVAASGIQASWLGGAVLIAAGTYQFMTLKRMCLDKCRSPLIFVVEHWGSRRTLMDTFRLGLAHGKFCVGCCWSLMLVMFAIGSMNLAWMLALGAVMAVERSTSWGARLTRPLGIALIVTGCATLIRSTV